MMEKIVAFIFCFVFFKSKLRLIDTVWWLQRPGGFKNNPTVCRCSCERRVGVDTGPLCLLKIILLIRPYFFRPLYSSFFFPSRKSKNISHRALHSCMLKWSISTDFLLQADVHQARAAHPLCWFPDNIWTNRLLSECANLQLLKHQVTWCTRLHGFTLRLNY